MSLRARVTILVAAGVAVAILAGSGAIYVIVRDRLRADVDGRLTALARVAAQQLPAAARAQLNAPDTRARLNSLRKLVAMLAAPDSGKRSAPSPTPALGAVGYHQYVDEGGVVTPIDSPVPAPLVGRAIAVAAGRQQPFFADARIAGGGLALQEALPLSDVDGALSELRGALLIVTVAGVALAAGLAPLISRRTLRPVASLIDTADRISRTRDLSERIGADLKGELGRLSAAFDRMLGALEASSDAQRQLVADASHELRTPLATLLMNIDLLAHDSSKLSAVDRDRLVSDLAQEIRELGALIDDLVELARDEDIGAELEDLRLDLMVEEAVARARRHAPRQSLELRTEPCVVRGAAPQLVRAVSNLLDNAIKWSLPGAPIEVAVSDGVVSVRDHGPGIDDCDLPHVFERFYRAERSRGLPGSGLGLAIVKQVAHNHAGSVEASNAPGGGALLTLALPCLERPVTAGAAGSATTAAARRP